MQETGKTDIMSRNWPLLNYDKTIEYITKVFTL